MKTLKTDAVSQLTQGIEAFFNVQEYKNILDFAVSDIDLSDDVSAPHNTIDLIHYPYMVQPLSHCTIQQGKRKEIVVAWLLADG